jgi:hypothetical protein
MKNTIRARKKLNACCKHQNGTGLFMLLLYVFLAMFVVLLLVFGFYEGRKAYWDYKVSEMCVSDGGLEVYEIVYLSNDEFVRLGEGGGVKGIAIPSEMSPNVNSPYYQRMSIDLLNKWNPVVSRRCTEYFRRSDDRLLARYTYYSRVGGDFPTWAHDSTFGCKQPDLIEEKIFQVKEGEK